MLGETAKQWLSKEESLRQRNNVLKSGGFSHRLSYLNTSRNLFYQDPRYYVRPLILNSGPVAKVQEQETGTSLRY